MVNLIGKSHATPNWGLLEANSVLPRNIAEVAAKAGVSSFFHVSSAGAAERSESPFLRAKWISEQLVQEAFPGAVVVRVAPMFGAEDRLVQVLAERAMLRVLPVLNAAVEIEPVWVRDVGEGLAELIVSHGDRKTMDRLADAMDTASGLLRKEAFGRYSLFGPQRLSYGRLDAIIRGELILDAQWAAVDLVSPVYKRVVKAVEKFIQHIPYDRYRTILEHDIEAVTNTHMVDSGVDRAGGGVGTLADLGIQASPVTRELGRLVAIHRDVKHIPEL